MAIKRDGTTRKYSLPEDVSAPYVSVQEDIGGPPEGRRTKGSGAVWTPLYVARMLVQWAIRDPSDAVLDPGSGRGIFLFESFRRLLALGANPSRARSLLYGVEQDALSFQELKRDLKRFTGGALPYVRCGNLFDCSFPELDVVVGNPPYVRRWWLDNLDLVRDRLPEDAKHLQLTRLTDLACYFTIYSARFLKPGGRLALVVADGWLDADYGVPFKRFLLQQFHVKRLITYQHRVFGNVLVRPVLVLAEKKTQPTQRSTTSKTLFALTSGSTGESRRVLTVESLVRQAQHTLAVDPLGLNPGKPWSQYLNAPRVFFALREREDFRPIGESFGSRIGLQTFGKSFFVVPRQAAAELELEEKHLQPLILSPRELKGPVISREQAPNFFLIWCDAPLNSLRNTQLARYIKFWEKSRVTARGGKGEFTGIQNLPRLKRAGRSPWYNVKAEVERRGIHPVLIPRRIFNNFIVAWNKAQYVAAENFLELAPNRDVDLEAWLALLNSSLAELTLKANAHLYGGGVYNLNPGDIKSIRLPDPAELSGESARTLRRAFREYVRKGAGARGVLDSAIAGAFGFSRETSRAIQNGVAELKTLSRNVKMSPEAVLFANA